MFSLFKLGSEKMKVFKTIFLCVVLVFALAGCGNSHAEADKTVKQGSGQKTDGAVNASEESTKGAAESATEGVQEAFLQVLYVPTSILSMHPHSFL